MTAKLSDFKTRKNSDKATGTSWGYRCSMLWDEKTASTDSDKTEDICVMVPTKSGLTDSSMSKRSSFQSGELKPLVVRSLRLGPQPTWRKVFMGFCLKARGLHLEKTPPPCEGWGLDYLIKILNKVATNQAICNNTSQDRNELNCRVSSSNITIICRSSKGVDRCVTSLSTTAINNQVTSRTVSS